MALGWTVVQAPSGCGVTPVVVPGACVYHRPVPEQDGLSLALSSGSLTPTRLVLPQGPAHRPLHVERRLRAAGMHEGRHEAPIPAVGLGELRAAGGWGPQRGAARLIRPSPRCLTGLWTSAFPGALTRRGGSTPVTSLRKHPSLPGRGGPRGAAEPGVRPANPPLPSSRLTALPGRAPAPSSARVRLRSRPCVPASATSGVRRGTGERGPAHLASVDGPRRMHAASTPGCAPHCWTQVVRGPIGDWCAALRGPWHLSSGGFAELWARLWVTSGRPSTREVSVEGAV